MPRYLFAVPYSDNQFEWPVVDGEPLMPQFLTGAQVERPQRDIVYEDRPILDEDGNPTGETESVATEWGDEYMETVDEIAGGSVLVSPTYQGDDTVALVGIYTNEEKAAVYIEQWFLVEEIEEPEEIDGI